MLNRFFGDSVSQWVTIGVAIFVIFLLLVFFSYVIRRLMVGRKRVTSSGRGRQPRLGVVDVFDLDGQRQLILVRRDNIEHLVMIGGTSDVVVESGIVRSTRGAALGDSGLDRVEPEAPPASPARGPEPSRPSAPLAPAAPFPPPSSPLPAGRPAATTQLPKASPLPGQPPGARPLPATPAPAPPRPVAPLPAPARPATPLPAAAPILAPTARPQATPVAPAPAPPPSKPAPAPLPAAMAPDIPNAARQIEEALKRNPVAPPAARPSPAPAHGAPAAPAAPPAPAKPAAPAAATQPAPSAPPAAKPPADKAQPQPGLDINALEEEMARLLGRSPKS